MAPVLPVGKRRPRHVAVSWAALRPASACQYSCSCSTEIKAQGCVEDLVCGGTRGAVSMRTVLVEAAIPLPRHSAAVACCCRLGFALAELQSYLDSWATHAWSGRRQRNRNEEQSEAQTWQG